jgi:hypothetical protein
VGLQQYTTETEIVPDPVVVTAWSRGSRSGSRLVLEHRSAATHECKVATRLNGVGVGQSVSALQYVAGRRHDAVPQRKDHQLGGGFRIPMLVRWPAGIKPARFATRSFSTTNLQNHVDFQQARSSYR